MKAAHNIVKFVSGLALCLVAFKCAVADDCYDEYPLAERFKIRIGGFLINRFDTTARFDSTQYPIGTLVDLEEDFNVDATETADQFDTLSRRVRTKQSTSPAEFAVQWARSRSEIR